MSMNLLDWMKLHDPVFNDKLDKRLFIDNWSIFQSSFCNILFHSYAIMYGTR